MDWGIDGALEGAQGVSAPAPAARPVAAVTAPATSRVPLEEPSAEDLATARPVEPVARAEETEEAPAPVEGEEQAQARPAAASGGLDISALPPEIQAQIQHAQRQINIEAQAVRAERAALGEGSKFAPLLSQIAQFPELQATIRNWFEEKRAAVTGAPAGQRPATAQAATGTPLTEAFKGLHPDQVKVIETIESRAQEREQAMITRLEQALNQVVDQRVAPLANRQNQNDAASEWATFVQDHPDWKSHVTLTALRQAATHAPHMPIESVFYVLAGKKFYSQNQQNSKQLTRLFGNERPAPPRAAGGSRRATQAVINDAGDAFDAALRSVGG